MIICRGMVKWNGYSLEFTMAPKKALVKVTNDLLKVYDCGHCCVFVLLDFSVALNTVDDVEHFMT